MQSALSALREPAEADNRDNDTCLRTKVKSVSFNIASDTVSSLVTTLSFKVFTYFIITQGDSCDDDASGNRTAAMVFQYSECDCNQNKIYNCYSAGAINHSGLSKHSALRKFPVATIKKSCENNFTVIYTKCENETTVWPGSTTSTDKALYINRIYKFGFSDGVPPDGGSIRVFDATHIATFVTFIGLYVTLLLFALGCILFNILFRNRRYYIYCFCECETSLSLCSFAATELLS